MDYPPVVVGVTGASGALLAKYTIQKLLDQEVAPMVVHTNSAQRVWHAEIGEDIDEWLDAKGCQRFHIDNIGAPPASGSYRTLGMVVVPCSMGTLAGIANGISDNLLERAADVCIKERRTLILVPRESPLSPIHLENMLKLARLGVKLLPPVPAFYTLPKTLEDVLHQVSGRVLDSLGIEEGLAARYRYLKEME